MIANVICKKCGSQGKFDVGDVDSVEKAQVAVAGRHVQECPWGHHVELSDIEYEVISIEEGQAMTDEEFVDDMKERGYDLWTTDELGDTEIEIAGFSYGFVLAKVRGNDFTLSFSMSPSGKRYYYSRAEAYADAIA